MKNQRRSGRSPVIRSLPFCQHPLHITGMSIAVPSLLKGTATLALSCLSLRVGGRTITFFNPLSIPGPTVWDGG